MCEYTVARNCGAPAWATLNEVVFQYEYWCDFEYAEYPSPMRAKKAPGKKDIAAMLPAKEKEEAEEKRKKAHEKARAKAEKEKAATSTSSSDDLETPLSEERGKRSLHKKFKPGRKAGKAYAEGSGEGNHQNTFANKRSSLPLVGRCNARFDIDACRGTRNYLSC